MKPTKLLGIFTAALVVVFALALVSGCAGQTAPSEKAVQPAKEASKPASEAPKPSQPAPQPAKEAQPPKEAAKPAKEAPQPIKVGVLAELTGFIAQTGVAKATGIEFAADRINAAGGIKSLGGAPIQLVMADYESDAKVATSMLDKLILRDQVVAILGPLLSSVAPLAGEAADRYQIPVLSFGDKADAIYARNFKFWGTVHGGSTSQEKKRSYMKVLKNFIDEFKIKHDRIAIVYQDYAAGQAFSVGIEQGLKEMGLEKNIVLKQGFDQNAKDLSPVVLKTKAAEPDIVFYMAVGDPLYALVDAQQLLDYRAPVEFHYPSTFDNAAIKAIGAEVYKKVIQRPGVFAYLYHNDDVPMKNFQDVRKDYDAWAKAKGKNPFDSDMMGSIQDTYALARAIENAGSRDRVAINNAIRKLSMKGDDPYLVSPSVSGISFTANGQNEQVEYLFGEWIDGKIKTVYPPQYRTTAPVFK